MKKWSFLLAASLLLSACSNDTEKAVDEQLHEEHEHITGDIQEETASADILPSFLNQQSDLIRTTYQIAGQAPDILTGVRKKSPILKEREG